MSLLFGNLLARCMPDSQISQTMFPPSSKFEPTRDIPDLTGKVVIVTGGNTGIGFHTVRELLLKNAKVYLAARSLSKAKEAIEKLEKETGKKSIFLQLDLGDLNSINKAAREFLSKENKLDILFNNAGVMVPPTDQLTSQGYDLQFGTNVLGHYYFTTLLLPALKRSTEVTGKKARVVNTSSMGHMFAPGSGIEWSSLKGGKERDDQIKKWGTSRIPGKGAGWLLYGTSKIGNIMFSHILNRYHGEYVASYSVHPGGIRTELQRHGAPIERVISMGFLHPVKMGPLSQLWAGTMPDAENHVGGYLVPWARLGSADPRSANEQLQDELKVYLEKQVSDFEREAAA